MFDLDAFINHFSELPPTQLFEAKEMHVTGHQAFNNLH
jgi:hypothetical protein